MDSESLSVPNSASASGTINVTATVLGSVAVTSVGFYVDNSLQATLTVSPYVFAWNTTRYVNGSHTISAVAHGAAGNTTTASASVMVVNTTPTSLAAQITWPTNGQTISRGTTFTIYATATN